MQRLLIISLGFACLLTACRQEQQWALQETIDLGNGKPLGIALDSGSFWIADAENNRVVKMNNQGRVIEKYPGFKRPMHLCYTNDTLYVPEYLTDTIKTIANGQVDVMPVDYKLDAPAGVAVRGDTIAIADFYNHRIVLICGDRARSIGSKGHGKGELFYPTDVAFTKGRLLIADAYNNRLQAWDLKKQGLSVVYKSDSLQTLSGVETGNGEWFITNSNKGTVHVISKNGDLRQVIREGVNYPTGLAYHNGCLFVADFHGQRIVVFQ